MILHAWFRQFDAATLRHIFRGAVVCIDDIGLGWFRYLLKSAVSSGSREDFKFSVRFGSARMTFWHDRCRTWFYVDPKDAGIEKSEYTEERPLRLDVFFTNYETVLLKDKSVHCGRRGSAVL